MSSLATLLTLLISYKRFWIILEISSRDFSFKSNSFLREFTTSPTLKASIYAGAAFRIIYTAKPTGIRMRMRPMAVKPAWCFALCISISFDGKLSHAQAMGCRAHTVGIVRAAAMGRKKRFAPILGLWHHPYEPLGVRGTIMCPYGKERACGQEGNFPSRRPDIRRAYMARNREPGRRCGSGISVELPAHCQTGGGRV